MKPGDLVWVLFEVQSDMTHETNFVTVVSSGKEFPMRIVKEDGKSFLHMATRDPRYSPSCPESNTKDGGK